MAGTGRYRWLKRALIVLGVLLAGLGVFIFWQLSGMFSRHLDDRQYLQSRFSVNVKAEIGSYSALGRQVRYIRAGRTDGPRLLFVHGSPGSWRDYAGYLNDGQLLDRAQLLAFDRPGFGETGGGPETSLAAQAALAVPLLDRYSSGHPTVVLGYSLGGPVAARLAIDYRDRIDALLLIAPSIDPELEERRWYNWLAALPGLSWLLPEILTNSNREIFPLKGELQKLRLKLDGLRIPTVVIQGEEDGLVPPANADFVDRMIPGTRLVRVPGVGHGILWQRRDLILAETLSLLARFTTGRQPLDRNEN